MLFLCLKNWKESFSLGERLRPSKEVIALGQTYFAIQTRKQELIEWEEFDKLKTEDEKRLFLRREMAEHNKKLADAAKDAGVIQPFEYAIFQNYGYMGLYDGLGAKEIHARKGLKKSQQILDHMGSTELAANLFRATQTEEKLRREKIKGKDKANKTHFEVGKRYVKPLNSLAERCLKIYQLQKALKKLRRKIKKKFYSLPS